MKTRHIFLALFILLFSNVVAEDIDPQVFNLSAMDTIWQAANNKVCNKDTATYYKLYHISDEPGLYTVNQYYKTGELYMTGRVTSVKPEHRDGDFYWFYQNGGKQRKTTYKNDREYSNEWWDIYGAKKIKWIIPYWKDNKLEVKEILIDKAPVFPGGEMALMKFVLNECRYPYEAKQINIQGRVIVRMVLDETGKVCYSEVTNKVNPLLEAEALRVVSKLPAWSSPAVNEGKPLKVAYLLPIVFKLPD